MRIEKLYEKTDIKTPNQILPELQLPVSLYHIFEQDVEHPPMELQLPLLSKAQRPGIERIYISELKMKRN